MTRRAVDFLKTLTSFPLRRLRWKIMAPFALLTVAFAILGTFLATRLVTGSLQERFTNQLVEASRVASDSVVRRERQHLAGVRAVAFTEGVPDAAAAGDAASLAAAVEPVAANNHLERVEVLDAAGRRVFGIEDGDTAGIGYRPLTEDPDRSAWPMVADVLQGRRDASGDKWAGLTQTAAGPALYTAGPIVRDGRTVGVVLVGSLLSNFLPVAKQETLADVTVYDLGGHTLASTFPVSPADRATLDPSTTGGDDAAGLREAKAIFGRDYQLLFADLRIRNELVGRYAVALPTAYIGTAGATARWQMALLFTGITLAVLVLGWLLASHFTDPLLKLARTARAVSSGDLSARSSVRSRDEIGTLATVFDGMTARLQRQHLATVGALASAIDARDPYTAGHSLRVGQLSVDLGRDMGFSTVELQHLQVGGYLHDIGKIGVRDSVLLKTGRLTPEERALVEQHPRIGLEILAPADLPPEVLAIVGGHHEKLNATGYPLALSADAISIFPRIAAVADIYDALTTDRPYRTAMSYVDAIRLLTAEAGEGALDPEVVAAMRRIQRHWEERRQSDPALRGFNFAPQKKPRRVA